MEPPIGARVVCGPLKLEILLKFRNINDPQRRILCTIFTSLSLFVGSFIEGQVLKSGRIYLKGLGGIGF